MNFREELIDDLQKCEYLYDLAYMYNRFTEEEMRAMERYMKELKNIISYLKE